jgi:hypothetical protein
VFVFGLNASMGINTSMSDDNALVIEGLEAFFRELISRRTHDDNPDVDVEDYINV